MVESLLFVILLFVAVPSTPCPDGMIIEITRDIGGAPTTVQCVDERSTAEILSDAAAEIRR